MIENWASRLKGTVMEHHSGLTIFHTKFILITGNELERW